jgi:enoyl-CoA hydratase
MENGTGMEDGMAKGVNLERRAAVAILRIDNPPLNLLSQDVRRRVGDIFLDLSRDVDLRAIVLASGPRHFCAGADMREFPARFDPEVARAHCLNGHRMMRAIVRCPKPVVGAVEGACLGGGMELALACDFRVVARSAKLGLPEIRRGVWPGTGGVPLLARLVGDRLAKRIVLGGEMLDVETAREMGIVDRATEDGGALAAALEEADRLAAQSATAVRAAKGLIDRRFIEEFEAHLRVEVDAYVACYQTADAREGNRAFFEKRDPVWTHR